MQVLIVEDEADLREIYGFVISEAKHVPIMFATIKQALLYLETSKPDVILTDLSLPQSSGLVIVEEAKRLGIPYIIASGYANAYKTIIPPQAKVLEKAGMDLFNLCSALEDAIVQHRKLQSTGS